MQTVVSMNCRLRTGDKMKTEGKMQTADFLTLDIHGELFSIQDQRKTH